MALTSQMVAPVSSITAIKRKTKSIAIMVALKPAAIILFMPTVRPMLVRAIKLGQTMPMVDQP